MEQERRSPRARPEDFEAVFVEIGRFECEAHFHARRSTVTLWMEQLGKQRLIDDRKAYVAQRRANGQWITRSTPLVKKHVGRKEVRTVLTDAAPIETNIDRALARLAAQHLRITRNGGFKVSPGMIGGWMVGLRRMTSAELVDLAVSRGFDPAIESAPGGRINPDGGEHAQST